MQLSAKGGIALEPQKPFSLGILVGRFQVVHAGHEQMIRTAIALCLQVGIFIGSSQESGTSTNPFPYDIRCRMLRNLFGDAVQIFPLPDIGVGNTAAWGDYVLENVRARFGCLPDLLVSGKESRRLDWFDSVQGVRIAELYIPKTIAISASQMRSFLIADDRAQWERYVSKENHAMYPLLREMALASRDNRQTKSI